MKLFTMALAIFAASAIANETQSYKLFGYPKDTGNCHEAAAQVGEAFARITGVEVIESLCEKATSYGYNLLIQYRREKPLPFVSTGADTPSLSSRGVFDKEEECRAAIATEREHFALVTGLTPVVAYCHEEKYTSDHPWLVRIDAFGEPLVRPRYDDGLIFGQILQWKESDFLAAIKAQLVVQGVDVRFVRFHGSGGMGNVTMMYYSKERVRLDVQEAAKLDKKEQCFEMLEAFGSLLQGYSTPLLSFCTAQFIGGYEVTGIFPRSMKLTLMTGPEEYKTYEECRDDRARLLEYYQKTLKRPTVGVLCSHRDHVDRVWRPALFENRP